MADVSANFVIQYQGEVHLAYQQGASKLRGTVRLKSGIVGASTKFPRIGKGEATQKQRHGNVVPMDLDHSMVECLLADWYAPDYVDRLDEFKISYDERQAVARSGAGAIGRKVDSMIIAAAVAGATTSTVGDGTTAITLDLALDAFTALNKTEAPDDMRRFAVVGPYQWAQLLKIDQFAKSNYIGEEHPFLKGTESRRWLNIVWIMHTGLPENSAGTGTLCLLYHQSAMGLAENSTGIISEINYVPEKVAHLANNMIGAGACCIDGSGVVVLNAKD